MNLRSTFVWFALVVLVSGCQATSIQSAWFNTDFSGPPFRKLVVVGLTDNVSDARVFEDTFAQKLRAAGVDGVAGHAVLPGDAQASDASFDAAVAKSGAQGLLVVRLLSVDTRTQVSTAMVRGGMGWGWGIGTLGPHDRTLVPVQRVTQFDLATVETKLFGVQTKQLVWAATTNTLNPRSVARETPAFADLIIGQLTARGILESQSKGTR
jgi:hypothetical protein